MAGRGCPGVLCGDEVFSALFQGGGGGGGSHRCIPLSQPTEWSRLLYINSISIKNQKKRKNKNGKEGRKAGGSEGGFRIHLLDRFDRFSKLVLLYVLVFLKLH